MAGRLSLGNAEFTPLKIFLRKKAKSFHRSNVAKTYGLVPVEESVRIWGYITLMCSQIKLGTDAPGNIQVMCEELLERMLAGGMKLSAKVS